MNHKRKLPGISVKELIPGKLYSKLHSGRYMAVLADTTGKNTLCYITGSHPFLFVTAKDERGDSIWIQLIVGDVCGWTLVSTLDVDRFELAEDPNE